MKRFISNILCICILPPAVLCAILYGAWIALAGLALACACGVMLICNNIRPVADKLKSFGYGKR